MGHTHLATTALRIGRLRRRSLRGRASIANQRGFTLAELLGVMAIISVLAAVATPGFVSMMRDRRTAQETGMFTDAFRVARARALGRGAAMRVEVRPSGASPGTLIIAEHLDGTVGVNGIPDAATVPLPGCNGPDSWRTVAIYSGRPGATTLTAYSHTDSTTPLTGLPAAFHVCYTPRGRTMVDYGGGGTNFVAMEGVATLQTSREAAGSGTPNRRILILPNGLTRMAL